MIEPAALYAPSLVDRLRARRAAVESAFGPMLTRRDVTPQMCRVVSLGWSGLVSTSVMDHAQFTSTIIESGHDLGEVIIETRSGQRAALLMSPLSAFLVSRLRFIHLDRTRIDQILDEEYCPASPIAIDDLTRKRRRERIMATWGSALVPGDLIPREPLFARVIRTVDPGGFEQTGTPGEVFHLGRALADVVLRDEADRGFAILLDPEEARALMVFRGERFLFDRYQIKTVI